MITFLKDPKDISKLVSIKCVPDDKDIPEYFIAKSKDDKVVHYGELTEGLEMATGQPIVTMNKDRKVWKTALGKLKIDPDASEETNLDELEVVETVVV